MYLAGPITGCSYAGCTDWRDYVTNQLAPEIECLSPMRAKKYLEGHENIFKCYEGSDWFKHAMSSQRGIMSRDFWDCNRCDILFVNFEGASIVSIGTCMEIAWCYQRKIPIVCVLDKLHDHAMIKEAITHPAPSVEQAIDIVRALV
jgi:nucleoside 2-deoxyribosyltransferase